MYSLDMPVHLLLLDPNRARRDAFHGVMHRDIVVQSLGDSALMTEVTMVDVAIIALRQTTGHGLQVGKALKLAYPRATVVVYGRIEGAGGSPTGGPSKVNERWGIDTHMAFVPEPHDVAALVETARLAEQRIVAAEAAKTRPSAATGRSWRELLTGPMTTENLKSLLRKDLFRTA